MSGSAVLVKGIKTRLKAQGISYRRLAELIGISEPTVKRDLARGNFSLQRLDLICDALGVSVADLVQPVDHAPLTELSEQQEQALVTNPRALVVTYLIVNICIDLGKPAVMNRQSVLRPFAMMFLALHWPCEGAGCTSNGIGHQH